MTDSEQRYVDALKVENNRLKQEVQELKQEKAEKEDLNKRLKNVVKAIAEMM